MHYLNAIHKSLGGVHGTLITCTPSPSLIIVWVKYLDSGNEADCHGSATLHTFNSSPPYVFTADASKHAKLEVLSSVCDTLIAGTVSLVCACFSRHFPALRHQSTMLLQVCGS